MASVSRKYLLANVHNSIAPFLYHTRTLTRPAFRSTTNQPYSTNTPQEGDDEPERSSASNVERAAPVPRPRYLQRHAAVLAKRAADQRKQRENDERQQQRAEQKRKAKPRKLTMTRGEKKVFGEILDQLERTGTDQAAAARQAPDGQGDSKDEMSQISAIFESVLSEFRGQKKDTERGQRRSRAQHSMHDEFDEEIGSVIGEDEAHTLVDISEILGEEEGKQVPMERAIDIIVRRESTKIEAALQAAVDQNKGDIGIWDVCRARIFSMLHDIGQDMSAMPGSREHRQQRREADQQQQQQQGNEEGQQQTEHVPLEIPSTVPTKPVVISLYPKMLLVAFRLLNVHFPSSPLISQFRSTIKSHGRASVILGTSTALYNELIYFYWRGCNDIAGVISLLQEMEVMGVEPSARTCGMLQGILRQREWDLKSFWYYRTQKEKENAGEQDGGNTGTGSDGNGMHGRGREPWWDMAPNRRAIRDLMGPEGWLSRLEERVQQLEKARRRSYA